MAGFIEVLVRALAGSGAAVHEVALAGAASVQDASCLFAVGGQSGEGVLTEPAAGAGSSPHVGPADEGATDGRPRGKGHAAGTPAPSNHPFSTALPAATARVNDGVHEAVVASAPQRRPVRTSPGSPPGGVGHDSYCP